MSTNSKEYLRKWRKKNPEKDKIIQKRYRNSKKYKERKNTLVFKTKNREYIKKWQKKYPKKVKELKRKWIVKNPDKNKEYHKRYREKNIEKVKEIQKEWRQNNPGKVKEAREKYYQKYPEKREIERQVLKRRRLKLRFKIFQRDNFTCQYCGRKASDIELQIDHKFPKSKGGLDRIENYQTLCKDCNIGKGDCILNEFLQK